MLPFTVVFTFFGSWILQSSFAIVTEKDVLEYLEVLAADLTINPGRWPMYYITNRMEDGDWRKENIELWIELVGIVCGNVNSGANEHVGIVKSCSFFESIAAHLLASLYSYIEAGGKDLSQAIASYGEPHHYITFDQIKGFLGLTCKRLAVDHGSSAPFFEPNEIRNAGKGCELMTTISVEYLMAFKRDKFSDYSKTFHSRTRPGMVIRFDQVKTLLPWICDRKHWKDTLLSCHFFTAHSKNMLQFIHGNIAGSLNVYDAARKHLTRGPLSIPSAKEFIANECKKVEIRQKCFLGCEFLLKNDLELLLFGPRAE